MKKDLNQVDPRGQKHDGHNAPRGDLTGNRDSSPAGIYCKTAWDPRWGKQKPVKYIRLFFLDEATALSAGHRPCNDCDPARFKEYKRRWLSANGSSVGSDDLGIKEIDRVLAKERKGVDLRSPEPVATLPDGALFQVADTIYLKWRGSAWPWSFAGYGAARPLASFTEGRVLTPPSVVKMLTAGFVPQVHRSAKS